MFKVNTPLLLALLVLELTPSGLSAIENAETVAPTATSDSFDAHRVFTEANQLFERARSDDDLRQAARGYETLLNKEYRNVYIHYNLANTFLRLGDLGRAILHFRRALLYDPRNPETRAMLNYARDQIPDTFEAPSEGVLLKTLFFWHSGWTLSSRLWVLICASVAFWSLLGLRLFVRLPFQRFVLTLLLVVLLAMGGSLAAELLQAKGTPGVIVERTEVRSGNGTEFKLVFDEPVQAGVEVRILNTRGLWHQVEFPGGAVGWLTENAVEAVGEGRG